MANKNKNQYKKFLSFCRSTAMVMALIFTILSCNNLDPLASQEQSNPDLVLKSVSSGSTKKGVGMSTSTKYGVWWENVNNLNGSWYYTWGTFIPDAQIANAPNTEFVPMFWNGSAATEANIAKINALYEQGKIKYLLGFNEPDLKEEANMTVEAALDKWEFICKNINPGIKLVSPVTSYPSLKDGSWMVQFMDGVMARNLRVDYVAVHIYQPNVTSLFTNPINDVYARWGKKVWITEFGVRDESTGGDPAKNKYTREQMLSFMQLLLPQLESMEAVDRYAWFNASPTMSGLWPCGLIGADGKTNS